MKWSKLRRMVVCLLFLLFAKQFKAGAADLLIEAESFSSKGGWVVDPQFSGQMGSPYLLAHGLGVAVSDATAKVRFSKIGRYRMFVRTCNWTAPWYEGEGPGKFQVLIDGKPVDRTFGDKGSGWIWQDGGVISVASRNVTVSLKDLTGFDGRCDAIYFTQDSTIIPPADSQALAAFRAKLTGSKPRSAGKFDLVVVGGGIAGICAAVSAARLGLKVALIHDRPMYGGNNSSEVRVHLGGRIGLGPYPQLGGIVKEFSPLKGGNAMPAERYEDAKKMKLVADEHNISQFLSYKMFALKMDGNTIKSVAAKNNESGKELVFSAPLFADCTGDGTLGYLAGADYATGRESREEYGEQLAPEKSDKLTMGSSVQWYSEKGPSSTSFPLFSYGVKFNEANAEKVKMGEWNWETGMNRDQVEDFEQIRDYGLLVVYSNWSFLKNEYSQKALYDSLSLGWVAYIAGKRESRRLMGDLVLKQQDIVNNVVYPDGTAATTWTIDLHYPDPKNTEHFPGAEFKSIAKHTRMDPYPIPYRCLYSRNIANLFMAGRDISVTHVALGTVRVMRTTGMMGEVVGMAASVCNKHSTTPRGVYSIYFDELKAIMIKGVGKSGTVGYPKYN